MTDRPPFEPSVLIDAGALSSIAAGTGIGTYVGNLLASLVSIPDVGLHVNALVTSEVVLDEAVGRRTIGRRIRSRARGEVVEHAIRLPLDVLCHRERGEIFHSPGFHAPWGIRSPWIQTLHDVVPLVVDEPDMAALRERWRRFGPRYRHADAVIAISRHTADEGIRLLGLDPGRIHIAHHGVDPRYRPDGAPPADPPYLLVVGEYSRRKGFPEAFAVLSTLADAGYPHTLKVVGRIHESRRDDLEALRANSSHPERIELAGFVADLATAYRRATVLLMTSRYEGFGLPVVEAMASGLPVVAFANSAVTEVVDGGGILVPDGDVVAMANAVRTLLDSPAAASECRQRGLARATELTWAKSAAIHAEVYRAVAFGCSGNQPLHGRKR